MSDLELEDIGINRTDIDAVFAGKYDEAKPNLLNLIMSHRRDKPQSPGKTWLGSGNDWSARSRR